MCLDEARAEYQSGAYIEREQEMIKMKQQQQQQQQQQMVQELDAPSSPEDSRPLPPYDVPGVSHAP